MAKEIKTALVTGASSGIGLAYAKAIARMNNYNLILVARRESNLNQLKQEIETEWAIKTGENPLDQKWVKVFTCDLSNIANRNELIKNINSTCPKIDLLVNNAGFGSFGKFTDRDLGQELKMVDLNCSAALHLCHNFLAQMKDRKSGVIINVASVSSFQPMPYMATYAATKAFLFSLSTALSAEAAKNGIIIQVVCPGPTESEFHIAAGMLDGRVNNLPIMTAEAVVSQSLEAISKKRSIIIPGMTNRFLAQLCRILPTQVSTRVIASHFRKFLSGHNFK